MRIIPCVSDAGLKPLTLKKKTNTAPTASRCCSPDSIRLSGWEFPLGSRFPARVASRLTTPPRRDEISGGVCSSRAASALPRTMHCFWRQHMYFPSGKVNHREPTADFGSYFVPHLGSLCFQRRESEGGPFAQYSLMGGIYEGWSVVSTNFVVGDNRSGRGY